MEELREGHDSQFSNLVTGSCTEVEKGRGRKRLGENIKIYALKMFNLRCLLDIQVQITRGNPSTSSECQHLEASERR